MSFMQEHHESKLEETISIPDELKVENDSLLAINENLRSKIEDVINNSNKKKTSLSLPKRELELVIKELVSTNEKFATVNKQLFILFNEQSIKKEQQHNIIMQADVIKIIAYELKTLTQSILGYSELLQMDFEQDTNNNNNNNDSMRNNNTFQKVLQVIVMSAKELQKLINEICNAAAKTENQTLNKGY
jgi:signal transduction histidine kinase